jgi:hypothetical protein
MYLLNKIELLAICLAIILICPPVFGDASWPPPSLASKEDYNAYVHLRAFDIYQQFQRVNCNGCSITHDFFLTINAYYETEWLRKKGAFSYAFWWIHMTGLPTSVEFINTAESEILMIISDRGYIDLKDEVKNNPESLIFTVGGMSGLIGFDVALALMELERKDQSIIVPEGMEQDWRRKITCYQKAAAECLNDDNGKCFDLEKIASCLGPGAERIKESIMSPQYTIGRHRDGCRHFSTSDESLKKNLVEANAKTASYMDLFMEKVPIELYRRNYQKYKAEIPTDPFDQRDFGLTPADSRRLKKDFGQAFSSMLRGDMHLQKHDHGQAVAAYGESVEALPVSFLILKLAEAKGLAAGDKLPESDEAGLADEKAWDEAAQALNEAASEYEAGLAVYGFERCEGLSTIPIELIQILENRYICLKQLAAASQDADAGSRPTRQIVEDCLNRDDGIVSLRCIDVNWYAHISRCLGTPSP